MVLAGRRGCRSWAPADPRASSGRCRARRSSPRRKNRDPGRSVAISAATSLQRLRTAHQLDRQREHARRAVEQAAASPGSISPTACVTGRVAAPALRRCSRCRCSPRRPARSTRGPGIPCTTSSLTEMQQTAGKGTLPGTPLNSGTAPCSAKNSSTAESISRGGHPRPDHRLGELMGTPDHEPARRIGAISRGERRFTTARLTWNERSGGRTNTSDRRIIQPARRPHAAASTAHQAREHARSASTAALTRANISSAVPRPSMRGELSLPCVIVEQRRRLHLEARDPLGENLGIVVRPLPGEHPPHELVAGHGQFDHPVHAHGPALEEVVERRRLRQRPRKAVEQAALPAIRSLAAAWSPCPTMIGSGTNCPCSMNAAAWSPSGVPAANLGPQHFTRGEVRNPQAARPAAGTAFPFQPRAVR